MNRYTWILGLVAVGAGQSSSMAAPPDFSICDGRTGVALGLCNGGVAAGCNGSTGGTAACLAIEERYRTVTGGNEPPWIIVAYPIIRVSLDLWAGLDLESGEVGYAEGMKRVDPSLIPYCYENDSCRALDLVPDFSELNGLEAGNPFVFWQRGCSDPSEPGIGGEPEYVVLANLAFEDVTSANIDGAVFRMAAFEQWVVPMGLLPQLGSNDTLIIHTCAGNYFKLGNQSCNYPESDWEDCSDQNLPAYWMGIDFQMLRQVP
jgi:hypothetical protein